MSQDWFYDLQVRFWWGRKYKYSTIKKLWIKNSDRSFLKAKHIDLQVIFCYNPVQKYWKLYKDKNATIWLSVSTMYEWIYRTSSEFWNGYSNWLSWMRKQGNNTFYQFFCSWWISVWNFFPLSTIKKPIQLSKLMNGLVGPYKSAWLRVIGINSYFSLLAQRWKIYTISEKSNVSKYIFPA